MKGSAAVIDALQTAAGQEATLHLQCHLDARLLRYKGLKPQSRKADKREDECEEFLEMILKRILLLEGTPSYRPDIIDSGDSVTAIFQRELKLELQIVEPYEGYIQLAMKALDDTTRNLFEHLLKWHEGHIGYLERELALIDEYGEAEYVLSRL